MNGSGNGPGTRRGGSPRHLLVPSDCAADAIDVVTQLGQGEG